MSLNQLQPQQLSSMAFLRVLSLTIIHVAVGKLGKTGNHIPNSNLPLKNGQFVVDENGNFLKNRNINFLLQLYAHRGEYFRDVVDKHLAIEVSEQKLDGLDGEGLVFHEKGRVIVEKLDYSYYQVYLVQLFEHE